jgi:hypothetical protein
MGAAYKAHRFDDKGRAIPLQARTGHEGSKRLKLPDFKITGNIPDAHFC